MTITVKIQGGATVHLEGLSAYTLYEFMRGVVDESDLVDPTADITVRPVQHG